MRLGHTAKPTQYDFLKKQGPSTTPCYEGGHTTAATVPERGGWWGIAGRKKKKAHQTLWKMPWKRFCSPLHFTKAEHRFFKRGLPEIIRNFGQGTEAPEARPPEAQRGINCRRNGKKNSCVGRGGFANPDLVKELGVVRTKARDSFYRGDIAQGS